MSSDNIVFQSFRCIKRRLLTKAYQPTIPSVPSLAWFLPISLDNMKNQRRLSKKKTDEHATLHGVMFPPQTYKRREEAVVDEILLSEVSSGFPALNLHLNEIDQSYRHQDTLETSPHSPTSNEPVPVAKNRYLAYLRHTLFTVYRRLFTIVFLVNAVPAIFMATHRRMSFSALATAASTNLFVAVLIRQSFAVTCIFRAAKLVPWSVPLIARRWLAMCYCYGGIHSGTAIAGTIWWIALSIVMLVEQVCKSSASGLRFSCYLAWIVALLLCIIITFALPRLRRKWHNAFELTHRFLTWTSLILFWTQNLLLVSHTVSTTPKHTFFGHLTRTPTFWVLSALTALTIYPWLYVRTWHFTATLLSEHAIRLSFSNTLPPFSVIRLSTSPLMEWHPFATFPSISPTGSPENALLISRAGDWTHRIIQQAHNQAKHTNSSISATRTIPLILSVRLTPQPGVLSLTPLFPRIILLTTGSGIGPCLSSLLLAPQAQSIRLIWCTRNPEATYGQSLLNLVRDLDTSAVIIDTDVRGRPDLARKAWEEYMAFGAEAVFVLGNERTTREVVGQLVRWGVPAFGPVFDS